MEMACTLPKMPFTQLSPLSLNPPDNDGQQYMYLSRVLVGEYTVGKQGMVTPPQKNQSDSKESFDCVVDQITDPSIFVIFYEGQFYPEYLITFSRWFF